MKVLGITSQPHRVESCILQLKLAIEAFLTLKRLDALIFAIRSKFASVDVVFKIRIQHGIFEISPQLCILDWDDRFHAATQIAIHPIGTADKDFLMPVITKVQDATVFKKTT